MSVTIAYLEWRGFKFAEEERLLQQAAACRRLAVHPVMVKKVARGHVDFMPGSLVAGGVDLIKHALRLHGKELPVENSYPEALRHLLYRDVEKVRSLREAKAMLDEGRTLFIKPVKVKRFTGFVTCDSYDPRFNGASMVDPVWISQPVKFVTEWRAYIAHGRLLDVVHVPGGGDANIKPDMETMVDAVRRMTEAGAPAGYALDFGVLSTGETALVEMNDGYSLGAYKGIDSFDYWTVIAARWKEMTDV